LTAQNIFRLSFIFLGTSIQLGQSYRTIKFVYLDCALLMSDYSSL